MTLQGLHQGFKPQGMCNCIIIKQRYIFGLGSFKSNIIPSRKAKVFGKGDGLNFGLISANKIKAPVSGTIIYESDTQRLVNLLPQAIQTSRKESLSIPVYYYYRDLLQEPEPTKKLYVIPILENFS